MLMENTNSVIRQAVDDVSNALLDLRLDDSNIGDKLTKFEESCRPMLKSYFHLDLETQRKVLRLLTKLNNLERFVSSSYSN